jgi:aminoglycoside 6'-N-acetyltransferase
LLRGEQVVLRPGQPADLDALEVIFASPDVARWWPMDGRDEIAADVLHRSDPTVTVYVIDVGGEVAGVIQSCEVPDEHYRSAGIDISLARSWHGTGVAVDAMRTLARHLFAQGHHRLTIDPAAHNARAIAAYAKVGFRPVGVMRRYERGADGTWHDGLLMDLLEDELG